ncbi:MAG: hypothetical protein EPN47_05475 [Acidobacteria bacterium]|nr:MAG: hypothetical protein EPN47_05475 [Acidobacteriota bacterium]
MSKILGKIGWGVLGTLFLVAPLSASNSNQEAMVRTTPAYNWAYAEEASGLLKQIRSLSFQAAEKADLLNIASRRNSLDWRSHAVQLDEIKTHINAMGEKLDRLQEIGGMIAPWQQKAVERIVPAAAALAGHTEGAIVFLNEHRIRLWTPTYTDRVKAMSEHVDEINNTVSTFLDYGKTSEQLNGLEIQIEYAGA